MKKIIDDQESLVLGPSSFSYPSALLSSSPFYAHLECVRVYSSLSLCKCVIKVSLVSSSADRSDKTNLSSSSSSLYIHIYTEPIFTPKHLFSLSSVCFSLLCNLSQSQSSGAIEQVDGDGSRWRSLSNTPSDDDCLLPLL